MSFVVELALSELHEAPWNANRVDKATMAKIKRSISQFGVVENLVVRPIDAGYEVISGNHRLRLYQELRIDPAPCHVIEVDDGRARLLSEALNHTRGRNDRDAYQAMIAEAAQLVPEEEILALIQESEKSLQELLGQGMPEGDASIQTPADYFGVLVECGSEEQQIDLLERLQEEGYECRAFVT